MEKIRKSRGSNKSFYHFKSYDEEKDETKYYFTVNDVLKDYPLCRATIYNWTDGKRPKKYPNVEMKRVTEHFLTIHYNVPFNVVLAVCFNDVELRGILEKRHKTK